ncbi:MAG: rod shape-determining protein MreC [Clostridia bacterium]|jgi:rod shape-determining protein MreC|nr:rod shape-determining protein MreC [Clostridia bacterium]
MKQFFKSKFFYIITVIALLCCIVPTVFYRMGVTFALRDAVTGVLTPMQKLFNYTAEAMDGFAAYFYRFDELVEENAVLREEVEELRSQIYDSTEREEMYAWMAGFLEMKRVRQDFKMMASSVTGRESGNYSRVLTLDAGSGAGVEVNMPVVTSEGVVGRITEVGAGWSRVTTVVESGTIIGAYVERTNEVGVCEGEFGLSGDGLLRMNYLKADTEAKVGDRVLSSGYGSVYPRGLVIGFIESMEVNPYTRGMSVTVRCAADFSELSRVMILTDFDTKVE